jgi:phosphatidylinositol alpha-1,6-mannosyltransferase
VISKAVPQRRHPGEHDTGQRNASPRDTGEAQAGTRIEDGADASAGQVLLLAPSRGLGGGIERYVQTVQSAFDDVGVACRRLDLARPGSAGHRALLVEAGAALAGMTEPARVVIAHRTLLPAALLLRRIRAVGGISVICHGSDVWGTRWAPRWLLERRLMQHPDVRLVAVSSFTAGALFPGGRATVLPPGLSRTWFGELVSAAGQVGADHVSPGQVDPGQASGGATRTAREVMTAFRLGEWRDKGLPQLTAAIAELGRADIRLTVCGSGEPPTDLLAHVGRYPWCVLRSGLSDGELARQFARASLFVLATRTRPGRRPCGEGFGLVLLEAQVAGTAVIGPAHGGSPDAYLDGVSGLTPRDESSAALAQVLHQALRPVRLTEMGRSGAAWARARFAPDRYAALAVDRLL